MNTRMCSIVSGAALIGASCGAPLTGGSAPSLREVPVVSREVPGLEAHFLSEPSPSRDQRSMSTTVDTSTTTTTTTTSTTIAATTTTPQREVSAALFVNGVQVSPTGFCLPDPNLGGATLCGDVFFASPVPVGMTTGLVRLEFPMPEWTISVRLGDGSVEFPVTVGSPGVRFFDVSGQVGTIDLSIFAQGSEGDAAYRVQITVTDPSATTTTTPETPTVIALPETS